MNEPHAALAQSLSHGERGPNAMADGGCDDKSHSTVRRLIIHL